jgi:sugar phosphate isomerase/epimerase
MLRHVFKTTSPRIGLCLDTAWALDSGEDPVKMTREFGGRLYGLHVKDFVFDRAGKPEDVIVGTGNLDLSGLVEACREVDFNGYAVLEYEGDVENPVPAVRKCVEAVRSVCQST